MCSHKGQGCSVSSGTKGCTERRCVAEDAARSAEDGDCLEAAEEPPELIPGGERQDRYTRRALRDHIYNYGINDAVPFMKLYYEHFEGHPEKVFDISRASGSQFLLAASARANVSIDYQR